MATVVGKDQSALKRVTCDHCASIVEYAKKEVREKTISDYGGGRDLVEYIKCPSCNADIFV
jgi:RNase P subunit RPR2